MLNCGLADVLLAQGQLDEADKTITNLEHVTERIAPTLPQPRKVALKRMIDLCAADGWRQRGIISRPSTCCGPWRWDSRLPSTDAPKACRRGRSWARRSSWARNDSSLAAASSCAWSISA